jgi:hypothetical protein
VRQLTTAPRRFAFGLTRCACQTAVYKKCRKVREKLQTKEVKTSQTKKLIIWPSCLEEFDWPKVGEFEVAIRAGHLTEWQDYLLTQKGGAAPKWYKVAST